MGLSLPADVLDEIFSVLELANDWETLSSCTLVCRSDWFPFASRRLFRDLLCHAAIAYAPGYFGKRTRLVTFKDFLVFVKTCERASIFTHTLTLLGRISSGYRGPYSTGPIRSAQLSLDVLVEILAHLPMLRDLAIKSVAICPPSMFFAQPKRPMFSLKNLEFDYQGLYTSALFPFQPMAFHLPDVVSLFSSVDTLTMWSVPQLRSAPGTTFTLPSASHGKTRLKTLRLGGSGFDTISHYLSALSTILSPGCLVSADIQWVDDNQCAINANVLERFLEGPGRRIHRFTWDLATTAQNDELEGNEQLPALPLSMLSRIPVLQDLTLTRRLVIDSTRLRGNQRIFENAIDTLLSTCPKRRSHEPILRKIKIGLVMEFYTRTDSLLAFGIQRNPHKAIMHLIRQLKWEKLDQVVDALGWDDAAAAEIVMSRMGGLLVQFDVPPSIREAVAQARDIITSVVSPRVRKVLVII